MLKWIKGSKSEHPLADDKSAREFIAELPPLDPYKSLEELCYWLDTLGSAEDLKAPRVLDIIDLIPDVPDPLPGRSQRVGCAEGAEADVVARALRALTLQLKWQLLRYGPVDQRVWEQMGKLHAYAEERGFAIAPVVVYPGEFGDSTLQREFLKGVMLNISSTDSLLPAKLEIAARIVAQFSEFFVINRQPAKGCHYYFDLNEGKVPARVMSRLQMTPGLRFFGPGSAAQELEKLLATVQADGVVPSNINLGGTFDPEVVLETLRHLARYWAANPPARSDERRVCVSRMSVVHDFDEIVSTVSGETQDLSFDSTVEVWTVENESESGYGALMPQARSDWLRVGTLLGVKLDDGASWGVGIVRRLSAYDHKQRYVGSRC